MAFVVELLPAFADNYIYIIGDTEIGLAMVVDPGDADVVRRALKKRDWHLTLILATHHHNDHIGGVEALKKEYGAALIGPVAEAARMPGIDRGVVEGDAITFSDLRGTVIETPGHTSGHIAFYFPTINALFCGDTMFSLGCGRLFEGTSAEMWNSLCKLRDLPDDTQIFCGHEYTEANARFAAMIDKNNPDLVARIDDIKERRRKAYPTIPARLGDEKKCNPFLRADKKDFQKALRENGFPFTDADPAALFGALRAAKDRFT